MAIISIVPTPFYTFAQAVTAFPQNAISITPSDTNTFSAPVTVYVGGSGNVQVTPWNSSTPVVYSGLLAGAVIPLAVSQVWNTNTTATLLIGMS